MTQIFSGYTAEDVVRHQTDGHRKRYDSQGRAGAQCSLWWRNPPTLKDQRLGVIGHYSAGSDEAAAELLEEVCGELAAQGCTLAVGPMDGCTWRRYRLVTGMGREPHFFLEPRNPPEWPMHFERAGFRPLAHYYSSLVNHLDHEDAKAASAEKRMSNLGIELRPLDPTRINEELKSVYQLVLSSFQNGFLFQPLPEDKFLAEYHQLQPHVRPELAMIATHLGQPVGFVFSIPDLEEAHRGETIQTVILKTLAVVPDRRYAGLGRLMTQQTHRNARQLGYRRVIHALMHESNTSFNISARYGQPFRRYTLFAKPL